MRSWLPTVLLVVLTIDEAPGAPLPTQDSGAPTAMAGTVYFYYHGYEMPPGHFGGTGSIAVLVDERVVATAKQTTYFGVRVAPGRHTFASKSFRTNPKETEIALDITAGQQVFIRLDMVNLGGVLLKFTAFLRVVDQEDGRVMLTALQPLDVKSIKDSVRVTTEAPAAARVAPSNSGFEVPRLPAPVPEEPGIYVLLEQALHRLPTELVTFRTTSLHGLTANLKNPRSVSRFGLPIDLVVRSTDGTTAADYVLLQLLTRKDRREFRTLDGGKTPGRQGPERMTVPFQAHRIGPNVYHLVIPALPRGEYGFVPPGAALKGNAVYTFGVD